MSSPFGAGPSSAAFSADSIDADADADADVEPRSSAAADREALAQLMLSHRLRAPTRFHVPRRFYWWAAGAGSAIGLVVFGGILLWGHPGHDPNLATSACERKLTGQLASTAPVQFTRVQAHPTGPRSYSISGTVSSVGSSGVPTVWTCVASSDGSTWTAEVDVI